jgi:hypothetical protein
MPILKSFTAPNGVPVSYHRLGQVEGRLPDLTVQVHSYVDREAFLAGKPPAFAHYLPFDARLLVEMFEQAALGLEALAGGAVEVDGAVEVEAAQARRWAKLKAERDARDFAPVAHGDFEVDADQQSRIDIMGAVMSMQAGGQSARLWRCADNVMRELTLADLLAIGTAIAARRQQLVETSDQLYQQLQAAETVEAVEAVAWTA